jgi:hypothetical protein
MKSARLTFSYFKSLRAYQLWSILLMPPGEKKEEAFKDLLMTHPTKNWGKMSYGVIDRHLKCKSPFVFQKRVDELRDLIEVASLGNLGEVLRGCRRYEAQMMRHRKFDSKGRSAFGPTDRIRIMGDKLQESYDRFNPRQLAA